MPISDLCDTQVVAIDRSASVYEAARLMRERHVDEVVVINRRGEHQLPVGMLADRDIVVGLIALGLSTDDVSVEDIMTPTLVSAEASQGLYETIRLMEKYGVHRLPIVDKEGSLFGIISSSDLLELLSDEIAIISRLSERQQWREREIRL
jgi:CBS domain-containing protein